MREVSFKEQGIRMRNIVSELSNDCCDDDDVDDEEEDEDDY